MRRKMDEEGFLPVTLIASFHRVQALTNDVSLVINAISDSDKLEMQGGFKVRTRETPTKWPIYDPKAENSDVYVPPPPLPRTFRGDAKSQSHLDDLNPDVAEFIPGQDSSPPVNEKKFADNIKHDRHNSSLLKKDKTVDETHDIWKEVRRRGKNATAKNKEAKEKEVRVEREELDFQFDEELDMPIGRNNQFSTEW